MDNYFVVLEDTADGGRETIYPEVHYVFSDDAFLPAVDLAEQQSGDISVLVDLDETGTRVTACRSLSPGWQVVEHALGPQALAGDHQSRLLAVTGARARQTADIPDLDGPFDAQVARGIRLVETLEQRNAELRRAIEHA